MRYNSPPPEGGPRSGGEGIFPDSLCFFLIAPPPVSDGTPPLGGELIKMICLKEFLQHFSNRNGGIAHAV